MVCSRGEHAPGDASRSRWSMHYQLVVSFRRSFSCSCSSPSSSSSVLFRLFVAIAFVVVIFGNACYHTTRVEVFELRHRLAFAWRNRHARLRLEKRERESRGEPSMREGGEPSMSATHHPPLPAGKRCGEYLVARVAVNASGPQISKVVAQLETLSRASGRSVPYIARFFVIEELDPIAPFIVRWVHDAAELWVIAVVGAVVC